MLASILDHSVNCQPHHARPGDGRQDQRRSHRAAERCAQGLRRHDRAGTSSSSFSPTITSRSSARLTRRKANPEIFEHLSRPGAKAVYESTLSLAGAAGAPGVFCPDVGVESARRRKENRRRIPVRSPGKTPSSTSKSRARPTTTSSPGPEANAKIYKSGVVVEGPANPDHRRRHGRSDSDPAEETGRWPFQLRPRRLDRFTRPISPRSPPTMVSTPGSIPARPTSGPDCSRPSWPNPVPITGQVRILRWRDDSLENRQGEIERMTVENSMLSFVSVPVLKIDSSIQGAGYGEAVTVGDKLIGLACSQGGDAVTAIPTSFIVPIPQGGSGQDLHRSRLFRFHLGTWSTIRSMWTT